MEGINQQLAPLFSNETLTADVFEIEVAPLPRGYSTIALYHGNTIYINVNDLDLLTPIEVAVTTLHEGNPGIFKIKCTMRKITHFIREWEVKTLNH